MRKENRKWLEIHSGTSGLPMADAWNNLLEFVLAFESCHTSIVLLLEILGWFIVVIHQQGGWRWWALGCEFCTYQWNFTYLIFLKKIPVVNFHAFSKFSSTCLVNMDVILFSTTLCVHVEILLIAFNLVRYIKYEGLSLTTQIYS